MYIFTQLIAFTEKRFINQLNVWSFCKRFAGFAKITKIVYKSFAKRSNFYKRPADWNNLWRPMVLYGFPMVFWLISIVGPRLIFGYLMISYGVVHVSLVYDFLWICIVFPMVLLCFWLILIIGSRPIFGYLSISYGFVLFSNGFAMLYDLNRRPSPDLRLSYDF